MVETALAFSVPAFSIAPLLVLSLALLLSNIRVSRQNAELRRGGSLGLAELDEVDPVTDALLRRGWTRRAEHRFRVFSDPVVIFIDVNKLKPVNDTLGHDAGDWLLHEFAARLRSAFGPAALIGRIGGDEFAVLLDNHYGSNWRTTLEHAAQACVVTVADTEHGGAFGIARSRDLLAIRDGREHQPTLAHVMRAADLAQMRAKRRCNEEGLAVAVAFYDESTDDVVPLRLDTRPWTRGRDVTIRPVRVPS